MIEIRKDDERGKTQLDWLTSRHTFSFGGYHDPKHVHFRQLRVINDDIIAPSGGFGTHPHNDMEIITFISKGQLEHKDSLGNGSIINSGEIQKMTAGSGIFHSEFNPSSTEEVHLYQIWLFPDTKGLEPTYEQIKYDQSKVENNFLLLASQNNSDEVVKINQDVNLYLSHLKADSDITYKLSSGRNIWVQVVKGKLSLNGNSLESGDGVAITDETDLNFSGIEDSELLLFDLS